MPGQSNLARHFAFTPAPYQEEKKQMTTKGNSFQFQQAGEPANPDAETPQETAPNQAGTGNEQPQYVTKAELDTAIAEIRKLAQSMTGKAEARIKKELERLQSAGIQATPEQVEKLVSDAERMAGRAQASNAAPPAEEEIDPISRIALKRMQKAGIDPATVNPADPDFHLINLDGDEDDYLESIGQYIEARKARAGSPAKLPTLAGGGAGTAGGKASIMAEMQKLMDESPSKHFQRIQELRNQLTKLK